MTEETYRVVAVLGDAAAPADNRYLLVNREMTWHEAQTLWDVADRSRRAGHMPGVAYFVVRQDCDPDPRWADAKIGAAHEQTLICGDSNMRRAAKRFATNKGIAGSAGGWIRYPGGRTICQGWDRFVKVALTRRWIQQVPAAGAIPSPRWYPTAL
jgi:hypothetical protein